MSSSKQIEANKLNSKKSTGPKTNHGKAAVSKNAVTHGLLSKEAILPWESIQDLNELKEKINIHLKPRGPLEEILVDRMVSLVWRLRRVTRIETGIITGKRYSLNYEMAQPNIQFLNPTEVSKINDSIRDEVIKENIDQAIATYPDLPELGLIFTMEMNAFSNLSRYEATLEKSLFKAHHELQRLQAVRQGKSVQLPIAIDVNHDISEI